MKHLFPPQALSWLCHITHPSNHRQNESDACQPGTTHEPFVPLLCHTIRKPSLGTMQDYNRFKCLYKSRLVHAVCPSFQRAPVHFCMRCIQTYTGYSTFKWAQGDVYEMNHKWTEKSTLRHRSEWQLGTSLQQPGEIQCSPMRTPESLPQCCTQNMNSRPKKGPNHFK